MVAFGEDKVDIPFIYIALTKDDSSVSPSLQGGNL